MTERIHLFEHEGEMQWCDPRHAFSAGSVGTVDCPACLREAVRFAEELLASARARLAEVEP